MRLTGLTLQDFRNYHLAQLCFEGDVVVFSGLNGHGKTNLLEAIFLCCAGRSHRTARERELVRHDQPRALVRATVERREGRRTVELELVPDQRRVARVDGVPVRRIGEMLGHLNAVMFTPEDLSLVKSGPGERRRFLDIELSQVHPAYFYALQRYSGALRQRNALLKSARTDARLLDALDSWDRLLAENGAQIIARRAPFVERLSERAARIHGGISGGESLEVLYKPSVPPQEDMAGALYEALLQRRKADIDQSVTSAGPHRDDLLLRIDGMDARAFASQGQKRTAALALKLSEIDLMREATGEAPLLLLDDVMSELDDKRREQLLDYIRGVQIFIACTSADALCGIPERGVQRFLVSQGSAQALE